VSNCSVHYLNVYSSGHADFPSTGLSAEDATTTNTHHLPLHEKYGLDPSPTDDDVLDLDHLPTNNANQHDFPEVPINGIHQHNSLDAPGRLPSQDRPNPMVAETFQEPGLNQAAMPMDTGPLSVQNDSRWHVGSSDETRALGLSASNSNVAPVEGPNPGTTSDGNSSHNYDAFGSHLIGAQRSPGMQYRSTEPLAIQKCNRGAKGTKKSCNWIKRQAPHIIVTEKVEGILAQLTAAHWESETYDVQQ
jgi:hypothetical protein